MEKNDLMKEYEIKIDSIVNWDCMPIGYAKYLESELIKARAKAEKYDRLMNDGLTMKELANILEHPVAIENDDDQNTLYYFDSTPHIGQFSDGTQFWSCKRKWRLPRQLVNFSGNWEDSLAFPDGWGEVNREETFDYNLEQLGLK